MKGRFILTLIIFPIVLFAQIEKIDVPQAIKVQFMEDYISASAKHWDKKENDVYTCSFHHQSHFKKATYSSEGYCLMIETKLTSLFQVPQPVAIKISKRYKFYIVDQIGMNESSGEVTFYFVIRKNQNMYELAFHPSGKLKSKTKYLSKVNLTNSVN